MSNKRLKDKVNDSISDTYKKLDDVLSEVQDIENEIGNSDINFNFLYKYIDELKSKIDDIDNDFYDFTNECDDLHQSISELLGKIGN